MTTVTNEDYWLHIVRNPYGHTDEQIRDARIHLSNAFETLRQRVAELELSLADVCGQANRAEAELTAANRGAERNAHINRELAEELAALKQGQGDPTLYACTKCGGANYGCDCDSFRYCTKPLYAEPRAAMIDINDFATPAYPAGDVTLLVAEIVRLRKKVANESVYLDNGLWAACGSG